MAHSTTVMPFFRASSFTSRSLVSSCIFARALRCSSRWTPNSCKGSVRCNSDGWHEANNSSSVEAPELVPDRLPPPPAVRTLPGFRERTGVVALDEPPGRVRGIILGDCWETGSKRSSDCALNDFFNGELGTGCKNVGLAREYNHKRRRSRTLLIAMDIFLALLMISLPSVSLVDTGIPDVWPSASLWVLRCLFPFVGPGM